jgi:hypothetical protein
VAGNLDSGPLFLLPYRLKAGQNASMKNIPHPIQYQGSK